MPTELERAVVAVHEVSMTMSDRLEPVLAEHGLTSATAHALWAIDPAEPPPSMRALADRLHCNASNLSFLSQRLIERDLVAQQVDLRDRRSRVLALTSAGVTVRHQVASAALEASPLAALQPHDLEVVSALLCRALGR